MPRLPAAALPLSVVPATARSARAHRSNCRSADHPIQPGAAIPTSSSRSRQRRLKAQEQSLQAPDAVANRNGG
jgi:hypothetical protein